MNAAIECADLSITVSIHCIVAEAWIVVYGHPPKTPPSTMNRLRHELFGYTDQSNRGRYEYDRAGVLSGKPYLQLRKGVIVVPIDLGPRVEMLLGQHGAWTWIRRVKLEPEDAGLLKGRV